MLKKIIIVIDIVKSGIEALKILKNRGYRLIYIRPLEGSFINVVKLSSDDMNQIYELCNEVLIIDCLKKELINDKIAFLKKKYEVTAIINFAETSLELISEIAFENSLDTLNPSVMKNILNKYILREKLKDAHNTPDFFTIKGPDITSVLNDKINFPFVIKPCRGYGKESSFICKNKLDLNKAIKEIQAYRKEKNVGSIISSTYIVEQYIEGSLFSAEVIAKDGIVQFFEISERYRNPNNQLLEVAALFPSKISTLKKNLIQKEILAIFNTLNIDFGLFHVEFLLHKGEVWLIEINARMMGSVSPTMYKIIHGINPYSYYIDIITGIQPKVLNTKNSKYGMTIALGSLSGERNKNLTFEKIENIFKRNNVQHYTVPTDLNKWIIKNYIGNLSVLGHVIVIGNTHTEVLNNGKNLIKELSKTTGINFAGI